MKDKLKEYSRKRDFRQTGEPTGKKKKKNAGLRFVIQKHDASHLHYDFRLAINGVLVSWAVPKGLSTDPRDKRLAIQTEDHPLDYINFEGVIPKGQYGGGTVLVWDTGKYRNLREKKEEGNKTLAQSLGDGLIEVWLEGKKLTGGYALKRIRSGKKPQWLIIKMRDAKADARRNTVSTEPDSVLTGRSLKQIATGTRRKQL